MVTMDFQCTNNQAEYEALIQGLQLLKAAGIHKVSVWGDSLLIIQQVKGEYQCKDPILAQYCGVTQNFSRTFEWIAFHHVYREENKGANYLAQIASGYKKSSDNEDCMEVIELLKPSSDHTEINHVNSDEGQPQEEDW